MILVLDNYDSFSYNLVQLAGSIVPDVMVVRNDQMSAAEALGLEPTHIILSPGPGHPRKAGICEELIAANSGGIPLLGVCLGHQAVCEVFGARIARAPQLMHGKKSRIRLKTGCPLFRGLDDEIEAARYHSLIAEKTTIPAELEITATDDAGEVMAVRRRGTDIYGLQFHPESILTPQGALIMRNFLSLGVNADD